MIDSAICDLNRTPTNARNKYAITFINDHSRYYYTLSY